MEIYLFHVIVHIYLSNPYLNTSQKNFNNTKIFELGFAEILPSYFIRLEKKCF